jgi:hypothetical protein
LETSKADEDQVLPNLQEALALTRMVAEHLASYRGAGGVASARRSASPAST